MFRSKLKEFLSEIYRLKNGKFSVLVGVSGGEDSVALLHGLKEHLGGWISNIGVAHLNHSLQDVADDFESFVKTQTEHLGLCFHSRKVFPPGGGVNLEAWGREERYKFFAELDQYDFVCTAHHANDVIESYLFKLFSGRAGLHEICLRTDERRRLLRPLWGISKTEITDFVKSNGISFVEDQTNMDESLTRNWIRHTLIPQIESRMNPNLVEGLLREVKHQASERQFLESLIDSHSHEPAVHWLKLKIELRGETGREFPRERILELSSALSAGSGETKIIEMGNSVSAEVKNGKYKIRYRNI